MLLLIFNIWSFSQLRASIWSSRLDCRSLWSGSPIHYWLLRHRWRWSLQERRVCSAWCPTGYGFVSSRFRPSEDCCSSVDAFFQRSERWMNGKTVCTNRESLVVQYCEQLRQKKAIYYRFDYQHKVRAKRRWELMRVQTLTLIIWPETLMHSHRLLRVFKSFLSFSPQLVIIDESWRKLSCEPTLIDSHPRLARAWRSYVTIF